ncbi:MAG: M20/M25/M40 family metallo-hydrolase [Alphaproteobacteria bacterium]
MNLQQTIFDLMKFRTETGNEAEIYKCLDYVKNIFANTSANVEIFDGVKSAPVIFISNKKTDNYDVLTLGHLDVVPAEDHMFEPCLKDGKLYGRGSLDMKSFAATAFKSMLYVLENNLDISFAIMLSTDEETGSKGTHAFMDSRPNLKANIVLDNDVGGDITKIINACKAPTFVKIIAHGKEAHGSTPWEGVDANDKLLETLANIRKLYPAMPIKPQDTWTETLHIAKINGGHVANVICDNVEALLDFRLTEKQSLEELENNLKSCLVDGVEYKIVSSSTVVYMPQDNEYILSYKKLAEETLNQPIEFEQIGGATDSRSFFVRGSTVIMHSGTGEGMHTKDEWAEFKSIEDISKIQIKFLEKMCSK